MGGSYRTPLGAPLSGVVLNVRSTMLGVSHGGSTQPCVTHILQHIAQVLQYRATRIDSQSCLVSISNNQMPYKGIIALLISVVFSVNTFWCQSLHFTLTEVPQRGA